MTISVSERRARSGNQEVGLPQASGFPSEYGRHIGTASRPTWLECGERPRHDSLRQSPGGNAALASRAPTVRASSPSGPGSESRIPRFVEVQTIKGTKDPEPWPPRHATPASSVRVLPSWPLPRLVVAQGRCCERQGSIGAGLAGGTALCNWAHPAPELYDAPSEGNLRVARRSSFRATAARLGDTNTRTQSFWQR